MKLQGIGVPLIHPCTIHPRLSLKKGLEVIGGDIVFLVPSLSFSDAQQFEEKGEHIGTGY